MVRAAAKAVFVLVGAAAGHVRVSIRVLQDLLDVQFVHILAANAKRITLRFVLMVWIIVWLELAQLSRKVSAVVALARRRPVPFVGVSDAEASETL